MLPKEQQHIYPPNLTKFSYPCSTEPSHSSQYNMKRLDDLLTKICLSLLSPSRMTSQPESQVRLKYHRPRCTAQKHLIDHRSTWGQHKSDKNFNNGSAFQAEKINILTSREVRIYLANS